LSKRSFLDRFWRMLPWGFLSRLWYPRYLKTPISGHLGGPTSTEARLSYAGPRPHARMSGWPWPLHLLPPHTMQHRTTSPLSQLLVFHMSIG
jgi:hypothetical protein